MPKELVVRNGEPRDADRCHYCGEPVEPAYQYCPYCGEELVT